MMAISRPLHSLQGVASRHFALALIILIISVITVWTSQGPSVVPANAPAELFSAERAAVLLQRLSQAPRPMGGKTSDESRQMIIAALANAGATAEIWRAERLPKLSLGGALVRGAHIENIIGRVSADPDLKRADRRSILLMAHYDSVSMSAGAGDDAMGVAAIVEALRTIVASGPLSHDLIILFTDGEEEGLLGARSFFEQHPLADEVGLVLNFDSRGNSGPVRLFHTGGGEQALINLFAASSPRPRGNGLTETFGNLSPNNTDLGPVLERDLPAYNFGVLGGLFHYHSPTDTMDNLSPETLQDMGEQAVTLIKAIDKEGLPQKLGPQTAYFDLFGVTMIRYPAALGWAPIILAFVFLLAATFRAVQSGVSTIRGVFGAVIVHLVALIVIGAGLFGVGLVLGVRGDFQDPFDLRKLMIVVQEAGLALAILGGGLSRRSPSCSHARVGPYGFPDFG